MLRLAVSTILVTLCLTSIASADEAAVTTPADHDIAKLLSMRVDQQHYATGIVVGVVDASGTQVVAHGTLGLSDPRRVNADTVYDIGSITKIITSLLLADMVHRGELALDDPVMKYLPADRVTVPSFQGRAITLADLATHTSGLPLRPTNLRAPNVDNKYAGYTLSDLYAFLSGYKLSRAPGSQYEYSNVGYGLIGPALSQRSGKSWAELVRARITQPLGMADTGPDLSPAMQRRAAIGYTLDLTSLSLTPAQHWDMGALESAGALRSTARDLMKLLAAALDLKPSPLKPAFDLAIQTRRPGGMDPSTEIALGWNIFRNGAREIVWKNGNVGGFRTFIGFDRAHKRGVVALANAQTATGADDIGLNLLDPTIPVDTHIPRPHKEIALEPAVLDRYVGRYRFSETDLVSITRQGDHLFCQVGNDNLQLFAESERDFFLKVADIQMTFDTLVAGRATKLVWHQGGHDQIGQRID
jgi:CubicO group peptidase (beta-lactamase class C family)